MSDLKDLTLNPFKVTWVNLMGISLWVENECPYQNDLMLVIWPNPIKMNGIDEKWMNRGRISEMKWNEWFEGFDLEQPYEKVPMVRRRCPYGSDLSEPYEKVPIKMMRFDWIEVE